MQNKWGRVHVCQYHTRTSKISKLSTAGFNFFFFIKKKVYRAFEQLPALVLNG